MRPMMWAIAAVLSWSCSGAPSPGPKEPAGEKPRQEKQAREATAQSADGRNQRDSRNPSRRPPEFSKDFQDATLRVDLVHRGTATTESYELDGLRLEGKWAGSRTVLVDPDDYGLHRFDVVEKGSGRLLFRQGYGSLFSEWQTTEEAKGKTRSFSESVRFPLPRRDFFLKLHSRRRDGAMKEVASIEVSPKRSPIKKALLDPAVNVVDLHVAGPTHRCLDIVIIAEGYTDDERPKAISDGKRFATAFFESPPFVKHKKDINIRLIYPISDKSGVSEPRKGLIKATPLSLSFNALGSPRYLMTLANKALRRVAAHAPYDQLFLMANTSRYGGGGIYNLYSTFPADNEYSEYVFMHEFGHTFGGLGDEYYTSPVATNEMYPPGVEPWEPNLTRFLGRKVKWKRMVEKATPLPTPPKDEYAGMVGLFEGAGYTGKGMYRPALDCKMFSKAYQPFCPVCAKALEKRLTRHTR